MTNPEKQPSLGRQLMDFIDKQKLVVDVWGHSLLWSEDAEAKLNVWLEEKIAMHEPGIFVCAQCGVRVMAVHPAFVSHWICPNCLGISFAKREPEWRELSFIPAKPVQEARDAEPDG